MKKHVFTLLLILSQTVIFSQENTEATPEENKFPILESCAEKSNDKKRMRCTEKEINHYIETHINKANIPEVLEEVNLLIKFSITEKGYTTKVQILKSTCTNGAFSNDVIKAFGSLPKFSIPSTNQFDSNNSFTIPITIANKIADNSRDLPNPKPGINNLRKY